MVTSKKILMGGLLAIYTSSVHATQTPHASQKNFSNLALGQSTALCFFGGVTKKLGADLYNSISYKEVDRYKRSMSILLQASGKGSVGLGLLSATYILISKYKISQR